MNQEDYKALTPKEKLFADLLMDIALSLRRLERDITADLEKTIGN